MLGKYIYLTNAYRNNVATVFFCLLLNCFAHIKRENFEGDRYHMWIANIEENEKKKT